jgi:protein-S-isoprenylcysteine O-methyltransferase Ste14
MKYLRAFLYELIPVIPLLGLPLLGWGLDDPGGFLSIYPRLGYGLVVVGLNLAGGAYQAIRAPERSDLSKGEEGKRVRRQSVVLFVIALFLFGILFLLPFADRRSIGVMMVGSVVRGLGLVLCGLGFALMLWSRIALGRMYSGEITIQKGHQLITTGLYRYIRHPVYLGILCFALGFSVLFRSWIGLAAMIPIVGGLLFRIKDEEAALHKEFGQEWEAYCKQSWRFIPYLY